MKIAYVAFEDPYRQSGVNKKIRSQIDSWKSMGVDVKLIYLTLRRECERSISDSVVCSSLKACNTPIVRFFVTYINRLLSSITLRKMLKSYAPDLIYFRHDIYVPFLLSALKTSPYVIELNSNDLEEYKGYGFSRYLYNKITRARLLSNASGYVGVTGEIVNMNRRFEKSSIVIANSFDIDSVPQLSPPNNESTNIIFVGSPGQRWHGTDKIMVLANLLPNCVFHIVGPEIEECFGVPNNVFFHGYKTGAQLQEIYTICDIAIGTLALHREMLNEACPLKVREYLAYGLPLIIGYDDPDLKDNFDWVLRIGNYEENVIDNIEIMKNFIKENKGKRISREVIKALLSVDTKEKERIDFLDKIINK